MEEKKYKSDLEMIREGSILKEYNIKKNFVNVTPAPTIGKVKISIVALNSGGKDFVDFYLDIDEFRQFCKEIDNGVAQKRIMEDNSPYPSAYKWTAGTNGCRHFNVGKGRAGVVLQVQNTAKKQSKMVAVTPHSLKKMAFLFRLLMGLVPVTPKTYYSKDVREHTRKYVDCATEYIASQKKFQKFGVPVNVLRLTKVTLTRDMTLEFLFELKKPSV